MKVRAQIAMVLNLDKCIGCHTCSVTCKNVWTNREGMEYAWFNNVETKPGIGYPKDWENQEKWNGGWKRRTNGRIEPRMGSKWRILANIFANPNLPEIDDYYEPFTFDYDHLQKAPELEAFPTARPRSLITGKRMEKIEWGPNWEEILGGTLQGIRYINDSKATTMESVKTAVFSTLESIPTSNFCYVLLGGKDKNLPWHELAELKNQSQLKFCFFGQCRDIAKSQSQLPALSFESMALAVQDCKSKAQSGDTILLSPGGTSLDEFKNFEDRGNQFKVLVSK